MSEYVYMWIEVFFDMLSLDGVQVIVILGVGGWFRQIHVASVPASLLQPFGMGLKICNLTATCVSWCGSFEQ